MDYSKPLTEIKKDFTALTFTEQWAELGAIQREIAKGADYCLPFFIELLQTYKENLYNTLFSEKRTG